jgi:integrase
MRCKKVPLHHRLFLGLLAREGLRASELRDLEWSNLDLDRGLLTLEENKTDSPRTWTLDPGVAEALRRWAKMLSPRAKQGRYVIVHWRSGRRIAGGKAASQLKAGLTKAKVSREALFSSTATRMSIRGHEVAGAPSTRSFQSCPKSPHLKPTRFERHHEVGAPGTIDSIPAELPSACGGASLELK